VYAQSTPDELGWVLQQDGEVAQQGALRLAAQLGGLLGQIFKGF
jgi:hypothetical protein